MARGPRERVPSEVEEAARAHAPRQQPHGTPSEPGTNGCNGRGNGTKNRMLSPLGEFGPPATGPTSQDSSISLAVSVSPAVWICLLLLRRRIKVLTPACRMRAGWPWALPRTCTWHLCYYQKSNVLCECQRKSYYGRRSSRPLSASKLTYRYFDLT